jgi:tetratricopeptide (TPR) repeat protein
MSESDDKMAAGDNERTPPPVQVPVPGDPGGLIGKAGGVSEDKGPAGKDKDRRRRKRGRVISIDEAAALAAWDKAAAFGADDEGASGEAEPPGPDSADLVLDVSADAGDDARAQLAQGAPAESPAGGFTGDLPSEPLAVTIDADRLGFHPVASDFRPHAIASTLAGELKVGALQVDTGDAARAAAARRAQLHLLVDELTLITRGDLGAGEIARAATSAARAADLIGSGDALRFYEQALAADPTFAPALRGRLRLLWRAGMVEEGVAIATALAGLLPGDSEAYGALVAELTATGTPPSAPVTVEPPALVGLLGDFERALRSDDRTTAIDPARRLADAAGGETAVALRGFADATAQLSAAEEVLGDAAPSDTAWANLRRALVLPADRAIGLVVAAAEILPSSPLSPALWHWAAQLARRTGDRPRAQSLLERARAAGAQFLAALEGVDLASDDIRADAIPAIHALLDRMASVPDETVAPVAGRFATALLKAGRAADAVTVVDQARQRDLASASALAPVLSNVIVHVGVDGGVDPAVGEAARAVLGAIDPARRSELALAASLATLFNPETRSASLGTLAQSPAQLIQLIDRPGTPPDAALAWWLAWQLRGAGGGPSDAAAIALDAAAERWMDRSPALAAGLRARSAVLRAVADIKGFAANLPVSRFSEITADDPAELVREMIAPGRDARVIAARFRAAAVTAGGGESLVVASPARIYEATGWSIQAGAFSEALAALHAAPAAARATELGRQLLRRLARLGDDAHVAAALLRDLAASGADPRTSALYDHMAAEILERTGQRAAAVALYRELLAGPLAKDADLGLRRALFALRDGKALMDFWRDEFDACSGAGRDRAAAAAAVEKACIALDLFEDRPRAADEIATALALDPDLLSARVMSLCHVRGLGGSQQRQVQLERLVQDMPGQQTAVGFFAALMADGEGEGEAALKLLAAAVAAVTTSAPLALMRRYVSVIERRGTRQADFAGLLAGAADRLVHTAGADPRLTTTVFLRAAEVAGESGDRARAESLTERARALSPDDLPALVRLARLQLERGDFASGLRHLEAQAAALRDPGRKAGTLFAGAGIAADRLGDDARARPLLTKVLDLEPAHEGAYRRLRKMLETAADPAALAALLARRAQAISGGGAARIDEAGALRVERAQLLAGPLGDRAAAKAELDEALALDPDNLIALGTLATLELEDGQSTRAIALTLRQAQLERDPARMVECFLRLGRLHREGARTSTTAAAGPADVAATSDAAAAVSAYEKVLEIEPGNREALAALSDLYAAHGEARRGIQVTERLLEPETDPARRRPLLLRLGLLWEVLGDIRRAGVCLRHAAEASPRDLQTLAELVRFYDRQKDPTGRNLPLDGAIALLHADFRAGREPVQALRTLVPLLQWRSRPAAARAAAQLLVRLTTDPAARAEASAAIQALSGQLPPPPSLQSVADDERTLPLQLPAGLPHVLRTLGPALARISKPDLRRFDVGRADRQGRAGPVRAAFDPLAVQLGVRDFDVFVTTRQPNAMAVEPGDPPTFVIGAGIAAKGLLAIRFAAAYCLRLYQTHFAFILRDGPIEAAALIAGLVRQFLPDHRPPYLPEAALKIADARVAKALNRGLRNELAPLANQLATGSSPEELFTAAHEVGARMGLIACGDLPTALDVLASFAGRPDASLTALMELPLISHLIDFALSEDHDALLAGDAAGDSPPS